MLPFAIAKEKLLWGNWKQDVEYPFTIEDVIHGRDGQMKRKSTDLTRLPRYVWRSGLQTKGYNHSLGSDGFLIKC